MTHPLLELPRLFRPRRDRAGKQAGTTDDDQVFVIVFVMMILPATTAMARAPARACLPWSVRTGEIGEIGAIARVYTNLADHTTANAAAHMGYERIACAARSYPFAEIFEPAIRIASRQSAATTASPICAVPIVVAPGVAISAVRQPCSSTFWTARSTRSACSARFSE